jgi:hypothetical protein
MEVRGEVYMPYVGFTRVNEGRAKEGEPLFANPRNAAAGGLRQLDPSITRKRRLRMFAFAVEAIEGSLKARTHWELLDRLQDWGFQVEPNKERFDSLAQVQERVTAMEELIPKLPFQADGVVVKVDRLSLHTELGVIGGREPRWAIARKFAPEVAVTRLLKIEINVGRTGALNPWASLEPVQISGVTVSSATLHNEDLIAEKDVREGDLVEIIRAGEVIPQVLRPVLGGVDPETRSRPWHMPDKCPRCGTPVERPADEAMRYCPNASCPGRPVRADAGPAGAAGPVRGAIGRAIGERDRREPRPPALEPPLRPGDPPRGQDGRGAARPALRHHAGAHGGRQGGHQRGLRHRPDDRRGRGRLLPGAAQPPPDRPAGEAGAELRGAARGDRGRARCPRSHAPRLPS